MKRSTSCLLMLLSSVTAEASAAPLCEEARTAGVRAQSILDATNRGERATVIARSSESAVELLLRVEDTRGRTLVERSFELQAFDCAQASELIAVVVSEFVDAQAKVPPRNPFRAGAAPAPGPEDGAGVASPRLLDANLLLYAGPSLSGVEPLHLGGVIGVSWAVVGSRLQLTTGLRTSLSHRARDMSAASAVPAYTDLRALASVGGALGLGPVRLHGDLRGGILSVSEPILEGSAKLGPWAELGVGVTVPIGRVAIGADIAVSPVLYWIEGGFIDAVPPLNVSAFLAVPIGG
jgi:hypothetical protein